MDDDMVPLREEVLPDCLFGSILHAGDWQGIAPCTVRVFPAHWGSAVADASDHLAVRWGFQPKDDICAVASRTDYLRLRYLFRHSPVNSSIILHQGNEVHHAANRVMNLFTSVRR